MSPKHISLGALSWGTLLGIIAFLVMSIFFLFALPLFDLGIAAALFIPDKLGLVEHPGPEAKVSMIIPGQEAVHFSWAGRYQIYRNILEDHFYEIVLTSQDTGQPIEIQALPRLNIPPEFPLFEFVIETPGNYTMTVSYLGRAPEGSEVLTILPDVRNQQATVAVIGGLVQLGLFSAAGWGIYRLVNRKKIQAQAAEQDEKRAEFESWLAEAKEKRKRKE